MTIKEMRTLLKLSQSQFAEKYGIPKASITNWEQGRRECPGYVLKLLERAVLDDYAKADPHVTATPKQFEDGSPEGITN